MSWDIKYEVRPADPMDRRDAPDAHEVRMLNGERPIRVVGVWDNLMDAVLAAATLKDLADRQIR